LDLEETALGGQSGTSKQINELGPKPASHVTDSSTEPRAAVQEPILEFD
jgi:hypothetical protein